MVAQAELAARLRQKTEQLAAVREISRAILQARDLSETLELITQKATEIMQVDSCSIYLYNPTGDRLELAASTGLSGEVAIPDGMGLTGWAAAHRETVVAPDALSDVRFYRVIGSGESKYASLMAMPLVVRNRVIGAANVQTADRHEFTGDEVELFGFITELTALALEKAQQVHAAQVQEMHHRVKNNLQTIAMLLRLQLAEEKPLSPKEILQESINRVLSIAAVHEILSETGTDRVDLLALVRRVVQAVAANMAPPSSRINITVQGDSILLPSRQATSLALVANELVQNALEHGMAGREEGNITVTILHRYRQLRLRVEDDGRGLPPGFNPATGLGLGLEIVRETVVGDLRGKFDIRPNRRGAGTHVQVTLPL
ncbi:MAG: GAF domain-containing protein [Chloroflexi bacterium]|nr:MAG: GAF domain-containing protein [Chloroflexota bacterium]